MRKQRTASHVVSDIGVKHVELLAALAGFTTLIVPGGSDYGFDLPMFTFKSGRPENGYVFLQVKSSHRLKRLNDGSVTVRLKRKHVEHWLSEPMPVIVVRYDRGLKKAYWLYIQRHCARNAAFSLRKMGQTMIVRIPRSQVLTEKSLRQFATFKRRVIMQAAQVIDHA